MEKAVSVIMPSLNVAPYIRECMDSVTSQTLQNIEIICIDAGSTDGTFEILQEYQAKDDRIKLIAYDVKSYGAQVNHGITIAEGKYIAVLETDDYIAKDMYRLLYEAAEEGDADYAKADYTLFYITKAERKVCTEVHLSDINDGQQYRRVLDPHTIDKLYLRDFNIWRGIYRKDFLTANGIRFNETPKAAFQDIGFLQQTLAYARRAVYLPDALYFYRTDREASSIYSVKAMYNAYYEFEQLLSRTALNDVLYDKGLYLNMSASFWNECRNLLRKLSYDTDDEAFRMPYDWFRETLAGALEKKIIQEADMDKGIFADVRDSLYHLPEYIERLKKEEACEKSWLKNLDCMKDREVIIFGAGMWGKKALTYLDEIGAKVVAFADNSPEKTGTRIGDIPIYPIADCLSKLPDAGVVVANETYQDQMQQQYLELSGVQKNLILLNKPLITVIIPVYNMEKLLVRCVDSVIGQTYPNLQIILVDDGSEDKSGAVCDAYAKENAKVEVIHQKNQGLSAARNSGMAIAKGEYIGFVDSDDYIEPDMYEELIAAFDEDVSIVTCGCILTDPDNPYAVKQTAEVLSERTKFTGRDAVRELLLKRAFNVVVWNKLYSREVIRDMSFPVGRSSEDMLFTYEAFKRSPFVVNIGSAKYYWYLQKESITRGEFKRSRMDNILFAQEIREDLSRQGYPYDKEAFSLVVNSQYHVLTQMENSSNYEQHKDLAKEIRKYWEQHQDEVAQNPYISQTIKRAIHAYIANNKYGDCRLRDVFSNETKFYNYYFLAIQWLNLPEESVVNQMKQSGWKKVAIYGVKELGITLYHKIKAEIEVSYFIDRNAANYFSEYPIRTPDDELEPVDAVIVTAVEYYPSIKEDMEKRVDCPIVSLQTIIEDALDRSRKGNNCLC